MRKRSPRKQSQSGPWTIIHSPYWIIKGTDIPLSLSFSQSFDHIGFWRVNFHFFDTNFCFVTEQLSRLSGLPYLPRRDNSQSCLAPHPWDILTVGLIFQRNKQKFTLPRVMQEESCLRYPRLYKMVPQWRWWKVHNRVTRSDIPAHFLLITPPFCLFLPGNPDPTHFSQIGHVMMSYTQPSFVQIWWKQKCLIFCSKILLNVLHDMSLAVLLPFGNILSSRPPPY